MHEQGSYTTSTRLPLLPTATSASGLKPEQDAVTSCCSPLRVPQAANASHVRLLHCVRSTFASRGPVARVRPHRATPIEWTGLSFVHAQYSDPSFTVEGPTIRHLTWGNNGWQSKGMTVRCAERESNSMDGSSYKLTLVQDLDQLCVCDGSTSHFQQ